MSLFVNQPLISLTPVATNLYDPVSLLPVSTQIYLDPTNIYYDPFKTYNALFPSYPGIYVSYPDVNADTKMQKDVIHKIKIFHIIIRSLIKRLCYCYLNEISPILLLIILD